MVCVSYFQRVPKSMGPDFIADYTKSYKSAKAPLVNRDALLPGPLVEPPIKPLKKPFSILERTMLGKKIVVTGSKLSITGKWHSARQNSCRVCVNRVCESLWVSLYSILLREEEWRAFSLILTYFSSFVMCLDWPFDCLLECCGWLIDWRIQTD